MLRFCQGRLPVLSKNNFAGAFINGGTKFSFLEADLVDGSSPCIKTFVPWKLHKKLGFHLPIVYSWQFAVAVCGETFTCIYQYWCLKILSGSGEDTDILPGSLSGCRISIMCWLACSHENLGWAAQVYGRLTDTCRQLGMPSRKIIMVGRWTFQSDELTRMMMLMPELGSKSHLKEWRNLDTHKSPCLANTT